MENLTLTHKNIHKANNSDWEKKVKGKKKRKDNSVTREHQNSWITGGKKKGCMNLFQTPTTKNIESNRAGFHWKQKRSFPPSPCNPTTITSAHTCLLLRTPRPTLQPTLTAPRQKQRDPVNDSIPQAKGRHKYYFVLVFVWCVVCGVFCA